LCSSPKTWAFRSDYSEEICDEIQIGYMPTVKLMKLGVALEKNDEERAAANSKRKRRRCESLPSFTPVLVDLTLLEDSDDDD
jgi:hypothetical protein